MPGLYDHPEYYDIAFSFRDIPKEADVFERSMSSYSRIAVRNILEIGCGNSPHMLELLKRGYHYFGLDLNPAMIAYSKEKALQAGKNVRLFRMDMADFNFKPAVDFAFVALGSWYFKDTAGMVSHFDSVSKVLKCGGLYFLDWCVHFNAPDDCHESWEMKRGKITVKTSYSEKIINKVEQIFVETIAMEIDDNGRRKKLLHKDIRRAVYPQEFLLFIAARSDFEFVGWWNNWDLAKPLTGKETINRPIIIIRRK